MDQFVVDGQRLTSPMRRRWLIGSRPWRQIAPQSYRNNIANRIERGLFDFGTAVLSCDGCSQWWQGRAFTTGVALRRQSALAPGAADFYSRSRGSSTCSDSSEGANSSITAVRASISPIAVPLAIPTYSSFPSDQRSVARSVMVEQITSLLHQGPDWGHQRRRHETGNAKPIHGKRVKDPRRRIAIERFIR